MNEPVNQVGESVVDWAILSDSDSKIFKSMPKSRQTLTSCVSKIGCLVAEVRNSVRTSPCWGIQVDESTDKADHAQNLIIMYVQFLNMESFTKMI